MNYSHLKNSYSNKRVFLTGHTGFKGSWMLYCLKSLGAIVKGYALDSNCIDDHYNIIGGDEMCTSIIGDIRNGEKLEREILEFEPDFIFHLAAQPLVRRSYEIPSETFEINAIGTAKLLDVLIKLKNPCSVVIVTTDKVYDNKEWYYPYRENDILGGFDPYSSSKSCAELIINSYRNSFFDLNKYKVHRKIISSVRAGNVIGGGDWSKDRIIPDIVKAIQTKTPLILRNPNAVRPWQHVLDPIGGYLHLASKMSENPIRFSGAWNFGPKSDDFLRVSDIVRVVHELWEENTVELSMVDGQPHEAGLLKLDISKSLNELNWYPKLNSIDSIKSTISWYKNYCIHRSVVTGKEIYDFFSI